ncbi:MAG: hypothetical protein ACC683_12635 [Acidimicrobiia bacterium]
MTVVALWSPLDAMLGVVAPLGAAAAVDTALVVDLDPRGPRYGGRFSLADLVSRGPTLEQLEPQRRGPAVLRNGGVEPEDAEEIVSELIRRWPHIVLRCPQTTEASAKVIALLPLLPEPFTPTVDCRSVYQRTHLSVPEFRKDTVLPVPRTSTIKSLLAGTRPSRRDRWVGALRQVWGT